MSINGATAEIILIAEDDERIAGLLRDYLQRDGFQTIHCDRGDKVMAAIAEHKPALALLDVMMPGMDGLSVCKAIRAESDLPIILATARVEEIDRLLGLELGADDYICKPFSPREVVARVKAVLRRTRARSNSKPNHDGLQIDFEKLNISYGNHKVKLTAVEWRLLQAMAERGGRIMSRAQLLDHMHDDFRDVNDRVIDSHIKNIRRKLSNVAPGKQFIAAIYGMGYRLDLDGEPESEFG